MPQEQFIPPCVTFNRKCSISSVAKTPILARRYSTEETFRIKIGCAFFVTFFAQAKKVENNTAVL